jgi:formylglycine-generating enzyme required for sulfatase activity
MVEGRRFYGALLAALTTSCSTVLGIDSLVADLAPDGGGRADAPGAEGGGGCTSTCGTPGCGDCPTPPRASVGAFSVDPYEVSVAAYRAWLNTRPSFAGQRVECAWNDSFEPGVPSPLALAAIADAGKTPDPGCTDWLKNQTATGDTMQPVVCVDWCDAAAYCNWAKGRLCGAIGGGALSYTADQMPGRGEWWTACSSNGANLYPYGKTYVHGTCNDSKTRAFDVGTYPGCQVNGIFDLSGNVTEWENSCSGYNNPPENENCLRRGGAFWEDPAHLACTAFREAIRGNPDSETGFRCCSTP